MSFEFQLGRSAGIALIVLALASCGGSNNSTVTPVTATPTFSVAGDPYTAAQTVSITDTTSGAAIYYTLDGTTPGTTAAGSTLKYSAAVAIGASKILQAIAVAPGHTASQLNAAEYTIGPAAAAAGIWVGSDSENPAAEILGFVTASGESVFIRISDYTLYEGSVTVTGTTFNASLDGFTNFPATFAANDNSNSGTGAFSATLGTGNSLVGAFTFSTINASYPSTWTLQYSSISLTGSSLAAVAGSYSDASTSADPNFGGSVTISATGAISSSGATSGCVLSGTISTADPTTDIYEVSYTYSGCLGTWADLNAVDFSGLAVLNTGSKPYQLDMGASGQGFGLVTALDLN